jgi:hypothetical protein
MSPKSPSCDDCYFRRNGLCALHLERPCPTFRAAGRTLEPPQQPRLVPRPLTMNVGTAGAVVAAAAAY